MSHIPDKIAPNEITDEIGGQALADGREAPQHPPADQLFRADRRELFWRFIYERQRVWRRRVIEQTPPPWTDDPILRAERFTNIYRELDPGTQYVIRNVLELDAPKPDKIFNTMLYRLIGRSETHAALGFQYLNTFDPAVMERALRQVRDEGRHPFTAAYMVSAYASMGTHDKITNVTRLFARLHRRFADLYARIVAATHPAQVYELLRAADGFGNFLAYQVLVDLLYPLTVYGNAPLLPYSHDDWAAAGPGAIRGIHMLLADGVDLGRVGGTLGVMRILRVSQREEFARLGLDFPYLANADGSRREISLANMQNCLCEFHKYVKIREGTGRGRRKFAMASHQEAASGPGDPAPSVVQMALVFEGHRAEGALTGPGVGAASGEPARSSEESSGRNA